MVIQRWQSVFLLIAAGLMGCFTFMPIAQVGFSGALLNYTTIGICGAECDTATIGFSMQTWILFIISLMSCIVPFISIFLYKNLKLQKKLCLVETLFVVATMVITYAYSAQVPEGLSVNWNCTVALPVLSIVFSLWAYCRINGDQKKLRSIDRIR